MPTEKKARKMLCPLLMTAQTDGFCLTVDCMMWRWDENAWEEKEGYCGLAGKPVIMVKVGG